MDMFDELVEKGKIHIRYQKIGPRALTIIEGLDDDLDQKRIARAMAKAFSCSTSVHQNKEANDIIQLQGDQREHVVDWLLQQEILTEKEKKERVVVHGG
jgi:translation initiation factor 1